MDKLELVPKVFDKKTVMKNVRESRLDYMFHRQLISESEFIAGSRYRRLCEVSQLGGRASTYMPRIDFGSNTVMDSKIGAFSLLAEISKELENQFIIILKYFCYQNFSITEMSNLLHLSQRKTSNLLHEALRSLAIYFGYVKVRNTIKGQGAKKMEIKKVSTMDS
tara:strand:+ start:791 stop:1285 length:495 start_codon:yes stop_codon:yes gene_type:complete